MKIWLAYKFRGSDLSELRATLENLVGILECEGHEAVTMIKNIQNWNPDPAVMSKDEAVSRAYDLAKTCDMALCIYPTEDVSEGRGWDAGYFAGMGKPTVAAFKKGVNSPYTEALFTENPANKRYGLRAIIKYTEFEDIADALPSEISEK